MPMYFQTRGSLSKTEINLRRMSKVDVKKIMEKYGKAGVAALKSATPVETSLSAASWSYKVEKTGRFWSLSWHNQNGTSMGTPVVVLLQYGHGTGTGGYVSGIDFINPAIQPLFQRFVSDIRREVRS